MAEMLIASLHTIWHVIIADIDTLYYYTIIISNITEVVMMPR